MFFILGVKASGPFLLTGMGFDSLQAAQSFLAKCQWQRFHPFIVQEVAS